MDTRALLLQEYEITRHMAARGLPVAEARELVPAAVVGGPLCPPSMGMIGEYLRVTAAEPDRGIQDPDRAFASAEEVGDAEEESEPVR
ncbi:hypothetical protein GCM10027160_01130 [Streptomyces calidiresistens]|uniref:YfbM family protein n=1 Tax=Streptomyces calidiresistens TaxID=1485586 RepID=UPI001E3051FD|nr:YfbM family protein [Streptomyces calidiresistens]